MLSLHVLLNELILSLRVPLRSLGNNIDVCGLSPLWSCNVRVRIFLDYILMEIENRANNRDLNQENMRYSLVMNNGEKKWKMNQTLE